jgi:hypothetical protein
MLRSLQWGGFLFLTCVSFFFTCNLALGLGVDVTEKVALVAGSLGIEVLKTYALIAANTHVHIDRATGRKTHKAALMYGAYAFVALYSLAACFGFALSTVDRMTAATAAVNHTEDIQVETKAMAAYDEAIASLKKGISDRRVAMAGVPADRPARMQDLQRLIGADQTKVDDYLGKQDVSRGRIAAWREDERKGRSERKRTMYTVIGETAGLSPRWVAFLVLAIFSFAIELGIFVTSPHGAVHGVAITPPRSGPDLGPRRDASTLAEPVAEGAREPVSMGREPAGSLGENRERPLAAPLDLDAEAVMAQMAEGLRSLATHKHQHVSPCPVCEARNSALAAYDALFDRTDGAGALGWEEGDGQS